MRIIKWASLAVAVLVLNACVESDGYYSEPSGYQGGYHSEMPPSDSGYRSSSPAIHAPMAATGGYGSSSLTPMQQSMPSNMLSSSSGYVSSH